MALVTCRLTAEDRDQLRNPMLISSMDYLYYYYNNNNNNNRISIAPYGRNFRGVVTQDRCIQKRWHDFVANCSELNITAQLQIKQKMCNLNFHYKCRFWWKVPLLKYKLKKYQQYFLETVYVTQTTTLTKYLL